MDALSEAHELASLASLTPSNVTNHRKWIYKNMYQAQRSGLMHAKPDRGRGYLLPQDQARRAELIEALGKLWDYIRAFNEKHLGVRARRSFLYRHGWAMLADPLLTDATLFASDASEMSREDGSLPEGSTTVESPSTPPEEDTTDYMLRTIAGSCDAPKLRGLQAIRMIGFTSKAMSVTSELTGPLVVGDSVARFEIVTGLRNHNESEAPRTFSS
ncbi:hypothetical protein A5775_24290 [Mycobacterium sp. 852002-10029_SCH5224772]|nr:hypothetical protein A5775_24290 [Mycobacterium sp. 852002-10029_SCH5224772]